MRRTQYVISMLGSVATLIATASPTLAGTIMLPGGSVTVPNIPTGTTVQVSGTYSQMETVAFRVSGIAYEQNSSGPDTNAGTPQYGTNAAGVLVVAGDGGSAESPGGAIGFANDIFGALLISLNGGPQTQIFATSPANGLASPSAPTQLTFSGPLSALFGSFGTVTNPQVTFQIADVDYNNNSGYYTVRSAVPEPSTWGMLMLGFVGLSLAGYRRARGYVPAAA